MKSYMDRSYSAVEVDKANHLFAGAFYTTARPFSEMETWF